jgi:hypothetical protein
MSDDVVTKLLPALEIAAFKRAPDGTFALLAPSPRWFDRLVADTTFPFLGHILEEATAFWQRGAIGSREWGPCAEVNEVGREFHYRVLAVAAEGGQFLVFQLDSGAERMREVLQKAREQALASPSSAAQATLTRVQHVVRRTSDRIQEQLRPLLASGLRDAQFELWKKLSAICDELTTTVDALAGSSTADDSTRKTP